MKTTRRVDNPREAAAYTFGYNPSLFAHRARDLLSVIALLEQDVFKSDRIDLVGLGQAGPWAAVARALANERVTRLATDRADFRFAHVDDLRAPMFLPGGAKYHDLPGALAVAAPHPLWLASTDDSPPRPVLAAYQSYGALPSITQYSGPNDEKLDAIVEWLLK